MGEIADDIAAVVAVRRQRLPEVRAEIEQWRRADAAVAALEEEVARLCGHPTAPPGLAAQLEQLHIGAVRPLITSSIELVQRLEARVRRGTVNIAISGAVGAGKSTVVRSITGLTDAELPTGRDSPVTAVPSRLHHTSGRRRAVLSLHTFDTFRATHLQPRYARAGLGESPADMETFRAAVYEEPNSPDVADAVAELRVIQAALWSYESLLDRPGRVLDLSGDEVDRLAEYVAYPGAGGAEDGRLAHRYLGVRHATVECPFPRAHHGAFTVVDLPGPHRGSVEVARRYFARLRYDVDVMLLVQRIDGTGPAPDQDDRTVLSILDPVRARGRRRPDFVLFVGNTRTRSAMAAGQARDARSGRVLEVDASDPNDVAERLLRPVLDHLVARLPTLDADLASDARALTQPVKDQLIGIATGIKAVVGLLPPMTHSTAAELYRRVDVLRARLSVSLRQLLVDLVDRSPREREQLRAAVVEIHAGLVGWLRDGLGRGTERWYAEASRGMARDGVAQFSAVELARVRVEIWNRYGALDEHLGRRLDQVWIELAAALSRELGALLGDRSGTAALAHLAELARTATEPCPGLVSALDGILAARLDYRTHLHPVVSTRLRMLVDQLPSVPPDRLGAERLYRVIQGRADLAAARIRSRLLRELALLPEQVLYAAVARFCDGVLADAGAEREIRQLARAYRGEVWPDLAENLDGADARVAGVIRAADELLAVTTGLATTAVTSPG